MIFRISNSLFLSWLTPTIVQLKQKCGRPWHISDCQAPAAQPASRAQSKNSPFGIHDGQNGKKDKFFSEYSSSVPSCQPSLTKAQHSSIIRIMDGQWAHYRPHSNSPSPPRGSRDSVVDIATTLRSGRSGVRLFRGKRFDSSPKRPDRLWGTRVLSRGYGSRYM